MTTLPDNLARWRDGDYVAQYANDDVEPVERHVLDAFREELSGRVLELGCGAGRLTGHLIALGGEVHGIDISAAMLAACATRHPGGHYREGDLRDLSVYGTASFDAVVGACNILDALEHDDRETTLEEVRRVLRPGGLLVMSAHNRSYAPRPWPLPLLSREPRQALRNLKYLRARMRNRAELIPLERDEADYALINDDAHDFALLHYFITPAAQVRQLEEHGMEVLEALDRDCRPLAPGDDAAGHAHVYYVARRLP